MGPGLRVLQPWDKGPEAYRAVVLKLGLHQSPGRRFETQIFPEFLNQKVYKSGGEKQTVHLYKEAEKSHDICLQVGDLGKLGWYSSSPSAKSNL